MNQHLAHRTVFPDWAKAFLVSLIVHVALLMLWVLAVLFELFANRTQDLVEE